MKASRIFVIFYCLIFLAVISFLAQLNFLFINSIVIIVKGFALVLLGYLINFRKRSKKLLLKIMLNTIFVIIVLYELFIYKYLNFSLTFINYQNLFINISYILIGNFYQ